MIYEIVFWIGLLCAVFALLGFVIGEMHGRVPKQRRDARGRFIGKGSIYGPMSNITHDIKINSPMTGLSRSKYPGKLDGWRTPKTQKEEWYIK